MKPFRLLPSYSLYLLALVLLSYFSSCKKDSFITSSDAGLSTTVDSLKYDTVFTSIGSVTQSFKIKNPNNQRLLLNTVKVMGGSASAFKLNVNGINADAVEHIEIAAEDSIYVFVTVKIDPNFNNLPFLVSDSIAIEYNGNRRFVQLEAYGQNANFLRGHVVTGNVTWNNTLPYVILGSVRIDTMATLTIDPGCKIYSHATAPFIVDGSLITNGTVDNPVIFTGDRLDQYYKDLPSSWPGIYFRGSSKNNVLQFTNVINAFQAIVAEQPSSNANPKLTLHQCIISNAADAGILAVHSSIAADNSLVSNCGNNVNLQYGGNYTFTHCTVAGYSSFVDHKNPSLSVANFATQAGSVLTAPLTANFTNCIFWGDNGIVDDEVSVQKQGADNFSVLFDHCLYKASNDPANSTIQLSIRNADPLFDSVDVSNHYFDFRTSRNDGAPGVDQGVQTTFPKDLDDRNRINLLPDIGAYEKQ